MYQGYWKVSFTYFFRIKIIIKRFIWGSKASLRYGK